MKLGVLLPSLKTRSIQKYPRHLTQANTLIMKTKKERYSTNDTTTNSTVRNTSQQTKLGGKARGHTIITKDQQRAERKPRNKRGRGHSHHFSSSSATAAASTSYHVFEFVQRLLKSNKTLYVRKLPDNFKQHGKSALQLAATESVGHSSGGISWIDNIEEFGKLRFIKNEFPESNTRLHDAIENYIQNIDKKYREINKIGIQSLNEKIAEFDRKWEMRYGKLPNLKLLSLNEKSKNLKVPNNLDELEIRRAKKREIKKIQESEEWGEAKAYKSQLETLKRNHVPKVYAMPGTARFDYLATLIRLVASRQTILFSFDVEAFEGNNNIITEIGISIFDPRENVNSLVPLTRDFHLIVAESLGIRNGMWVCDTKECYLMGQSIVLSMAECVKFIQTLIDFYMVPKTPEDETWYRAYVAHNVGGDIKWLQRIGIRMPHQSVSQLNFKLKGQHQQQNESGIGPTEQAKGVPLVFDTAKLCQESYGNDGASLGKMLRLFGIPHAYLHNAGNDSNFTLKLLLHLCDIEYRQRFRLDDIELIECRARLESERDKNEPKILPMLYLLTIKEAEQRALKLKEQAKLAAINNGLATVEDGGIDISNNVNGEPGDDKRKKEKKSGWPHFPSKNLVPQTEFGGMQWFPDAYSAFKTVTSFKE